MDSKLSLPLSVVSRGDVNRLERELFGLEEFMAAAAIRQAGAQPKLPKLGSLFEELLRANQLNALVARDRAILKAWLAELKKNSPILHMSFSSDPPPRFIRDLIAWLRQNIHPTALLSVGLQPGIGAGCIVRTRNRYFDLSLRRRLWQQRDALVERLHAEVSE